MQLSRRSFLSMCLGCGGYLIAYKEPFCYASFAEKEALYYQELSDGNVQCLKCPHFCSIKKNKQGFCRIRVNKNGKLFNVVYGKPCAVHVDPIEKKPLFHVLPGSKSFSIATVGCNLRCKFCQNWQISQAQPNQIKSVELSPDEIVAKAKQTGCLSIAYTYTEPTVFYEYTIDIAEIAKSQNVLNVMHSNCYINPDPLRKLCTNLAAANVDLKSFSEDYYKNICSGSLKDVLKGLVIIKKEMGIWLELTNLIVPTLNDKTQDLKKMCKWVYENLGDDVPIHFSRFFPMYKLTSMPPTPVSTLEKAKDIAQESGLKFVYIGNLPGHPAENTHCPNCKRVIIKRSGYTILENNLKVDSCGYCNKKVPGLWV